LICGSVGPSNSINVGNNHQAFFGKCSANGKLEEHKISNESGTHCEYITYANGNYVFAGYKVENDNDEDIYIGKIDINTMDLVTYSDDISHKQRAYAVQASGSGYLFAGHNLRNDDADPYVFRMDKDFNTMNLCPPYSNVDNIDEIYITAMTTTSSGGYMFVGYLKEVSGSGTPINGFMLEMDSDCNYDSRDIDIIDSDGENVEIYTIAEVDNGRNYLICGNRKSGNSRYAYGLKLSSKGKMLNEYRYGDSTFSINERIAAAVVGSECNYTMAGFTEDNEVLVVRMKK